MPGIVPRNMEEWIRKIERDLQQARAGAGSIAAAVAEQRYAEAVVDSLRVPAAPVELTATTYIALSTIRRFRGQYMAGVTVDFPDVTVSSDATPMAVSQYELWGRTGTDPFTRLVASDTSAPQWFGAEINSLWDFKVRAVAAVSGKLGLFSDVITVRMLADTTAPPQPSVPVAATSGKAITLRSDGLAAGGGTMPLDTDYVIVAAGVDPSPTTEVYRFAPGVPDLFVDTDVEYNTPKFYRLQAVDTSGNASPWSEQAVAYATPLVDEDLILSHIDASQTELENITADALVDQAITRAKLAASDPATFAPSYRESPTDWTLDGGMTAKLDATVGAYDGYRFTSTATTGNQRAMGPQMAVQPGEELYGEAVIYRTGPTTNKMYPRFYFFDANHTYIVSGGTELDGTAQKQNEPNGTKLAIKAVVPANAMYANFMMTIINATGDDLGFYNARSYRRSAGELLKDGSINTTKLVVTGENMMWNGFGQNLYNASWSDWGFDTVDKAPGTLGSFTQNTQITKTLANNQPAMPVEENTGYVLEGWIKASVAGSVAYIESMEVGGTDPNPRYILNAYAVPTAWTRFSVPVITSVGQTAMTFRMFANHSSGTVTNAVQKIGGLRFRKQVTASVIVSGGIITDHLTVDDTMWAKIIKFKQLTGAEIDVNALKADSAWIGSLRTGVLISDAVTTSALKADAITSKHSITGALIQTTTTANRGLKFTSTGLKMWDPAGVLTVDLNATTGYATVTGRVRTGPDGQPGVVLIPPSESNDAKTMAVWFTPDTAILPGSITAGLWISNPTGGAGTPGAINLRGQSYGGVNLFDEVEFMSGDGTIPRMASNHGSGLQITSYSGTLYASAPGAELRFSSLNNTFLNIGANKQLTLQSGGGAYNRTLSGTANCIIYTDGNVFKVSSASKYKIAPQVMELDDRLLDEVTVKDWIDIGMAERYAESFDVIGPLTEDADREFRALSLQRIPGTIAEDVEAAGGEKFVVRDLDGEIDSLMYDRFALARTEILKRRAAAQAAEIVELRQLITDLAARIPA